MKTNTTLHDAERRLMWMLSALCVPLLAYGCQPSGEAATLAEQVTSDNGQETGPSVSPDGSMTIFAKLTAPGNPDIYVIHEGGAPMNLTADNSLGDSEPAFSPDGQQIAFRSEREGGGIFVMAAAGGAARRVVGEGFNPSWSPDGQEIVYGMITSAVSPYGAGTATNGIRSVNVQSGETRVIYGLNGFQPRVSPDGQRIAFWHYGNPGAQRDIWTIRMDGTDTTRVTNDEAVDWSPLWSNDGTQLYFASDRDGAMKIWRIAIDQVSGVARGEAELVTADAGAQIRGQLSMSEDGVLAYMDRTEHRALFAIDLASGGGAPAAASRLSDPTIAPAGVVNSPDGEWLAFTRGQAGQEDIYVMKRDGSGLLRLTDDPYRDRVPTWSPDGSTIAFRSDRPDTAGVRAYRWHQINRDGTGLRLLASGGGTALVWSPDGSKVAVQIAAGITLFDAGGANPRVVAQSTPAAPLTVTVPVFSPDGRRLAYREVRGDENANFVLDVTGGSPPRAVARVQGALGNPIWSPDGRRVAYRQPGVGTFVLDVTRSGASPERLPSGMDLNPLAWSADGNLLMGNRPAADGRPVAPVLYDFTRRAYEVLAEEGAGGQWFTDGSHVVVTTDEGTRLQLIDRASKTARELFAVTPPSTFTFGIGSRDDVVYYLLAEPEADIYTIRVP
jgi:Tol biopolymer transport system component